MTATAGIATCARVPVRVARFTRAETMVGDVPSQRAIPLLPLVRALGNTGTARCLPDVAQRCGRGYLMDTQAGAGPPEEDVIGIGQGDAGPAVDAGPHADAGAPGDAGSPGAAPPAPVAQPQPTCVIDSKATVHAPDGTADDRKTIGVCETIEFSVGGSIVDWTADNGWPSSRSSTAMFRWAAPETAGTSRITATDPITRQSCNLTMSVIAPNDISMIRRGPPLGGYAGGTAGAGMTLEVRLHPRHVNFGWTSILEDPGPGTGVAGYFAAFPAAALRHAPNLLYTRVDFNSAICCDTAATAPGTLPSPWSAGTYRWIIPNRYRAFNNATGAGHLFTRTLQVFTIDAAGRVTVTKQGQSVSRSP